MRIKNDKTDLVFFLFTDHLGGQNERDHYPPLFGGATRTG